MEAARAGTEPGRMRVRTLLYHDVAPRDEFASSGFPGAGADIYKLTPCEFETHLDAIAAAVDGMPIGPGGLLGDGGASGWAITFDDGGRSASERIADMLEARGWLGFFFMTTQKVDSPPFMSRRQLRDLAQRGHTIGSHSHTHPTRMSRCTFDQMLDEWTRSRGALAEILGEDVRTASVPGGYYSREVARAAAESGLRVLFNSEPTPVPHVVNGCLVLGRHSIQQGTSARTAAAIAAGRWISCARQWMTWNAKKVVKKVGGESYLAVREKLLRRR